MLTTNVKTGLGSSVVRNRQEEFGPNELAEKVTNPILVFLSYFWVRLRVLLLLGGARVKASWAGWLAAPALSPHPPTTTTLLLPTLPRAPCLS